MTLDYSAKTKEWFIVCTGINVNLERQALSKVMGKFIPRKNNTYCLNQEQKDKFMEVLNLRLSEV